MKLSMLLLMAATLIPAASEAKSIATKKQFQVDLNAMISDNIHEQKQVSNELEVVLEDDLDLETKVGQQNVIDFIDLELSIGEKAKVVDRRYQ